MDITGDGRSGGGGRALLAAGMLAIAAAGAAGAQAPQAARPNPSQTWADQQRGQAFATRKLDASPLRHEWVTVQLGGRTLRAFVTHPAVKGKTPVVLVLHEVFGLTDSTRNTADQIAALGYTTVAPDMLASFGPNGGGIDTISSSRMAGMIMTALPDEIVNGNIGAWIDYARDLPQSNGKVAIVGLSWGGGAAFRYAATPGHDPALKTVCIFYDVGPPAVTQGPNRTAPDNPPVPVAAIDIPIHGFYGSTDTRVIKSLPATTAAMAAAGKTYDPVVYEGADHAFMRVGEDPADKNPANPAAVKAATARLRTILQGL